MIETIDIKYKDANGNLFYYTGNQNEIKCNNSKIPTGFLKEIEDTLIKWMEEKVTKL